jgi:hypothetical protein
MDAAKYIIFQRGTLQVPVIFPTHVNHKDMARPAHGEPISAGFCRLSSTKGLVAYGRSESLMLSSEEGDSEKLNAMFGWET